MSNLQPNCCLKFDFQKVDQHAGGKWLIHDTKRRAMTISCKAWNSPAEYPSWVARCDIKGSVSTMLNPIFSKKVQGQKHPGRWGIVEHQIPSIKVLFKTYTYLWRRCYKLLSFHDVSSVSCTMLFLRAIWWLFFAITAWSFRMGWGWGHF